MEVCFNLPNGPLTVATPPVTLLSPAERIWHNWRWGRMADLVLRSGVVYCGAYPKVSLPDQSVATLDSDHLPRSAGINISHPETVSDHTRGCKNLITSMSQEFPGLFAQSFLAPTASEVTAARDRLVLLLEYHDRGEMFTGDIPDDGARDENAKDSEELHYFLQNLNLISNAEIQERLLKDFVNFQHPQATNLYDSWTEYDGNLAQLARLVDKLDAVLAALKDESEGHAASLEFKAKYYNNVSERDREFVELCGTSMIADCWAAQFLANCRDYHGYDEIVSVLRAAVLDVRGQWYPWWNQFCQQYHINP